MCTHRLLVKNLTLRTLATFPKQTQHPVFHSQRPQSLSSSPSNYYLENGVTLVQSQYGTNQEPFLSASLSDSLLVEKVLLGLKQGKLNHLCNYLCRLNPVLVVEVIFRCRENLQLGLKFIDLILLNCPNFKHSSQSLSAMIHILVRGRRVLDAQALILRMVRKSGVSHIEIVDSLVSTYSKCGSNSLVFDLLVRTYVQARKLREGFEALKALRSNGFCVSINAGNSLLGGLVKVGWVDLAWEVYGELVSSRIQLNVYTLNIMVNALCKDGKIDGFKLFISNMAEKGVCTDIVTYNTLINAYCREGLLEEAFQLKNSMASKGLRPELFTYNAMINGLCKVGNYARAKEVLYEMLQIGLSPDTTTYNTLLVESSRKDIISEAKGIFHEMSCPGVVPDLVSFSSIIGVLSRNGHIDHALLYFRDMKIEGFVPDNVIYTILINGYCRNGKMLEALKLQDEMLEQGCVMDVVTFNTILNGLCREKMLGDADKLFNEMVERGVFPDLFMVIVNTKSLL
ncbi:hypothetical protein M0R45_016194 [Rubus argutus]|uniref:Pentatricopeptide repeat-containing protein n=1 Tax=Rubus argutus TaxID=59490 RepID=A0AAW1XSQ7_RUBAR